MPTALAGAAGVGVLQAGSSVVGASIGAKASKTAAGMQAKSQREALEEQRRQFDAIRELLSPYIQAGQPNLTQPYVQAGPGAVQAMQALAGLGGEAERQRALYELQQSPQFANLTNINKIAKGDIDEYNRQRAVELKAFQRSADYKKVPVVKGQKRKDAQADLVAEFNQQTAAGIRDIESKAQEQAYTQRQALMRPILDDQKYTQIGVERQRQAIQNIEQGPLFQELARQGEEGMLQNAAATGGLRGGNVQGALAQFRPNLLNQLIEAQYGKLAGLTSLGSGSAQNLLSTGQASAAGTAAAQQNAAQNIGNLMVGQGAAMAGGQIGAANAFAQGLGGVSSAIGGGMQNYMLMQQLNKPSMASGLGTGGFAGSYQDAQAMYGGAPVAYQAPIGPGAPYGYYKQS
jgi:hypothetical protein